MRAYRLGQAEVLDSVFAEIGQRPATQLSFAAAHHFQNLTFDYIDRISPRCSSSTRPSASAGSRTTTP